MASRIIPPFAGPLTPTAIEAWLGLCEDGFAIYASTKTDKSPDLDVATKIRLTGTNMQEPSMAAWWSVGRSEFLKLTSWESFEKMIRSWFLPKGFKLMALRAFFVCSQGLRPFLEYVADLAEARNAAGHTAITSSVYKFQLLFHAHNMLVLRIMAIPDFDIDTITFDNLVALMAMQWDSLVAEGSARPSQAIASAQGRSAPAVAARAPLSDAEKEQLTAAGACWRCRKTPKDPKWTPHIGRTCPGDEAQGILPGRDYIPPPAAPIKREVVGMALLALQGGEDQPDQTSLHPPYPDDDTSEDEQPVRRVAGGALTVGDSAPRARLAIPAYDNWSDQE